MGDRLPLDYNYRLYSSLVAAQPAIKDVQQWQMGFITGKVIDGYLKLGIDSSFFARCLLSDFKYFEGLENQIIRVGQSFLQFGELTGKTLQPATSLYSPLVAIRRQYVYYSDPFQFGVAVGRKLTGESYELSPIPQLGEKRVIQIKETTVVGYSLRFENLTPAQSLRLQVEGIGASRRMGCGVFVEPEFLKPKRRQ